MWRTARLDAIFRRTKLSRSSAFAARSTESTKPRAPQGAGRANLAAPFRGAFTTSTGDRVQRGEEMLRTWMIAGLAVAASTGPTLGQDAAAGEQVFKRLCSPCHEIGQDAKIKLGPPLNGIDGRKSGTFEGFNYSPANKSSGITWSEETFPKYIRAPMQEMPGTRMAFVGIKNDKDIADLSSNSLLMGRRNETRRAGKRGKSKRATRPGSPSGSSHVSVGVDWPAQPYLKPAQTI